MIHSFLMIGQSNMASCGAICETISVITEHINSASLHAFGIRYFEVFETRRDPNKVFVEEPAPNDALRDVACGHFC